MFLVLSLMPVTIIDLLQYIKNILKLIYIFANNIKYHLDFLCIFLFFLADDYNLSLMQISFIPA
jgi:hypothetical protein